MLFIGTLSLLNLVLAVLVLSVLPRTCGHRLLALWFAANGLAEPILAFLGNDLTGDITQTAPFNILAGSARGIALLTGIPIILLPWVYPRPILSTRQWRLALAVILPTFALGLLISAVAPSFWLNLIGLDRPANWIVQMTNVVVTGGLVAGVFVYLHQYIHTKSDVHRGQVRWFLAAYVSTLGTYLVVYPGNFDQFLEAHRHWETWGAVVNMAASALLSALGAGYLVAKLVAHRIISAIKWNAAQIGSDLFILAALGVGVLIPLSQLPDNLTWLLLRPLLFTYAVLRYNLLDVPVRSRTGLLGGVFLLLAVAFVLAAATTAEAYGLGTSEVTAVVILTFVALVAVFVLPVVRMLLPMMATPALHSDVYHAALDQFAHSPSTSSSGERVLKALRSRLGISEREHQHLLLQMQGADADTRQVGQGRLFLGRYRVGQELGKGGFGRTYLAHDERLDRTVVLKVLDGRQEVTGPRALREARALARIGHPGIVSIYDVEEVGDQVILVLEHLPGRTLADRLANGPLTLLDTALLGAIMAGALEAAHKAGLIHRDVKPSNILFDRSGAPLLADFGLMARSPHATAKGFTLTEAAAGSIRYMSPEQVKEQPLDERTDLYSLGVTLYEALTGRSYLDLNELESFEARRAILEDRPKLPISNLPVEWNDLLGQLLDKDPDARPNTAAEVRQSLEILADP